MQSQRYYADDATYQWFKRSSEQASKYIGNKYFQLLKLIPAHMYKEDEDLIHKVQFALINIKPSMMVIDIRTAIESSPFLSMFQNTEEGRKKCLESMAYEAKKRIFRYIAMRVFNTWNHRMENVWLDLFDFPNDFMQGGPQSTRLTIMEFTTCAIQKLLSRANVDGYKEWKAKWEKHSKDTRLIETQHEIFTNTSIYKFFKQLDESHYVKMGRKNVYALYKAFCVKQGLDDIHEVKSFGSIFYHHLPSTGKTEYVYGKDANGKRTKDTACTLSKAGIDAFLNHMRDPIDTTSDIDDGYMSDYSSEPLIGMQFREARFEDTIEYFLQQNPDFYTSPVEAPVDAPIEKPVEKPVEEPVEEPIDAPIEELVDEPVEESVEESVEVQVETSSDDEVVDQPAHDQENDSDDDSESDYESDYDLDLSTQRTCISYDTASVDDAKSDEVENDSESESEVEDEYDSDDEFYKPIDYEQIRLFNMAKRQREDEEMFAALEFRERNIDINVIAEARRDMLKIQRKKAIVDSDDE